MMDPSIERYYRYIQINEQKALKNFGHESIKHYDTVDLISAQVRGIRQCMEYLNGDEYLKILVDHTLLSDGD